MSNLINEKTIESLKSIGGEDFAQEMIDIYKDNLMNWHNELKQFIEHKNWELARKKAHLIKGASLNIGAEKVKEKAYEIEKYLTAGNNQIAINSFEELQKLCENTLEVLENK